MFGVWSVICANGRNFKIPKLDGRDLAEGMGAQQAHTEGLKGLLEMFTVMKETGEFMEWY